MDFSKFSVGLYEIVGLIFPGFLVICEGWITVRGWDRFIVTVWDMNWVPLLLLAAASFAVGELVQELSDAVARTAGGKRCLKTSRDKFWTDPESSKVKRLIHKQLTEHIEGVDAAFDYCLTKIAQRFPKRDTFMLTSDLSGALVVVALLSILPICRFAWMQDTLFHRILLALAGVLVSAISAVIAWVRMVRFREFADLTVFRIYVAACTEERTIAKGEKASAPSA